MEAKTSKRQNVTVIIDENLNKLKGKVIAPETLEDANKHLSNLKTPLPDC